MTGRSVRVDGEALRSRRRHRGASLKGVADEIGIISKSTIHRAEKGGPVDLSTVKALCDFYHSAFELEASREGEAFARIVEFQDGEVYLSISDAREPHELVRIVIKHLGADSSRTELSKQLELLRDLLNEELLRLRNPRTGSFHFDLELSPEKIQIIEKLFSKNGDGEVIIPDLTGDETSIANLKRYFEASKSERAKQRVQSPRIQRMLRILHYLQSDQAYDPVGLSIELEVTRRTVYRDIAMLRELGFNISFDGSSSAYVLLAPSSHSSHHESGSAGLRGRSPAQIGRPELRAALENAQSEFSDDVPEELIIGRVVRILSMSTESSPDNSN